MNTPQFSDINITSRVIGRGMSSIVYMGTISSNANIRYAVKVSVGKLGHQKTLSELEMLKEISHPSIVEVVAWNVNDVQVAIILPYANGGDLDTFYFHYIIQHSCKPSLSFVKNVFEDISTGIHYLHMKHIAHGDIKLENVMMYFDALPHTPTKEERYSLDYFCRCVLIDFGFAKKVTGPIHNANVDGTPFYLSPEHFYLDEFDPIKTDMWALGVFMWYLVYGSFPFDSKNDTLLELSKEVLGKTLVYEPLRDGDPIPEGVIQLLQGLLNKDAETRLMIEQARDEKYWEEVV